MGYMYRRMFSLFNLTILLTVGGDDDDDELDVSSKMVKFFPPSERKTFLG